MVYEAYRRSRLKNSRLVAELRRMLDAIGKRSGLVANRGYLNMLKRENRKRVFNSLIELLKLGLSSIHIFLNCTSVNLRSKNLSPLSPTNKMHEVPFGVVQLAWGAFKEPTMTFPGG